MKKTVLCVCHEPIAVDRTARQGWGDVWLRWHEGRKRCYSGPTIMSRPDVEGDLDMHLSSLRSNKAWYRRHRRLWVKSASHNARVLRKLDAAPIVVSGPKRPCPDVYLNTDCFDRAGAEAGLRALMAELGHHNVRFKWKRPAIVVHPFSIGRGIVIPGS